MKKPLLLALTAALIPACGGGGGDSPPAVALPEVAVVTLAGNVLTTYAARAPGVPLATLTITGTAGTLVGMDYRPANGALYVVSDNEILYSINLATGAATPVGPAFATALSGTSFAVDFNPQADRLRIASNLDQNLRVNPGTGAIAAVDTNLIYDIGDASFGANPDVVAFAYTNNFAGAISTTLFGIDRNLDILVYSTNPNGGLLRTAGPLGVDVTDASFDIASDNQGYLAMARQSDGLTHLYSTNLATGAATNQGLIGTGGAIQGMSVAALPAFLPASGSIVALKGGKVLVNYNPTNPNLIAGVLTVTGATGNLVGIDYRPATGELLAISDADLLYSINTTSGAATAISVAPFSVAIAGTIYGFDVNPVADRVRVVTEADENQRLNPSTGDTVDADVVTPGVQPDSSLAYAVGDPNFGINPQVVGAAYTNSFAGAPTTVLHGIDIGLDVLVSSSSPNLGAFTTVGALGVNATEAAFDIAPGGTAYAALTVAGTTALYTVNLPSGVATVVGTLGSGGPVNGLTVKP